MSRLYLDCDGVLADFDGAFRELFGLEPREHEARYGKGTFWRDLHRKAPQFYVFLPLKEDAHELFDAVAHLEPTILTGCPGGGWAEPQKVAWAGVHFPGTPIITCRARDKATYCQPGDVLVDDQSRHRELWTNAGGVFILHRAAAETIPQVLGALEGGR